MAWGSSGEWGTNTLRWGGKWSFAGPFYTEKRTDELWFVSTNKGITIFKTQAGTWGQTINPTDSDLATYARVYRGGFTYSITSAERDELTAAGYGAYIR